MSKKEEISDESIKKILEKLFYERGGSFRCINEEIQRQLIMGYRVELEHSKKNDPRLDVTDGDPLKTIRIALVHILEGPDYYTRLKKMENEMDAHWEDPNNFEEKKKLDRSIEESIVILS